MEKIILDCDPGIDDALAIILAAKSPKIQVKGITTVAGNSSIENTAKNALKVLDVLGKEHIPVYKGAKKPLKGQFLNGALVHGKDGLAENNLREPQRSWKDVNATDFLLESVQKPQGVQTIIATGPLTNIANGIQKDPLFKENIKKLIIMGGAIKNPGNVTRTAEFNIFADPEAARIVFESGIKNITLVPLDVTQRVIFTSKMLKKIGNENFEKKNTFLRFVNQIISFYTNFCISNAGYQGCPLHDPLAVGEVIDSTFMEKKALNVKVVTKSETFGIKEDEPYDPSKELIRGQTVAELRKGVNMKTNKPNINVCLHVEKERFLQYFIETINS